MRKNLKALLIFYICFLLSACSDKPHANWGGRIMVLSISSDGHYVISSDVSQHVVLWDLVQRSYRVVANHANIYSAYFIKNTHDFIYQSNQDNTVYVENVEGKILQKLHPGFPTYGEAMTSDLQRYIAVDDQDQVFIFKGKQREQLLYHYCGPNYHKPAPPAGAPYTCGSFLGGEKLFNLTLSDNEEYFINSGFDEVFLWDLSQEKLLRHFVKNRAKTFAVIAPNNNRIFSADENFTGYKYNINTQEGKVFYYTMPKYPALEAYTATSSSYTYPSQPCASIISGIVAIKFIDNDHLLAFFPGAPTPFNFAALYPLNPVKRQHVGPYDFPYVMKPIKYIPLSRHPLSYPQGPVPATLDYERDQAIDTVPAKQLLVMGQQWNNGIIVYHYDPQAQTLQRVWDAVIH